jgi:acetyl/propionyl-CoA carboxylase alpha subunit
VNGNSVVGVEYDPILAKLITYAPDRDLAIAKMINALKDYKILGIKTSRKFMIEVLEHPDFIAGRTYTDFIERYMSDRNIDYETASNLAAAVSSAAMIQSSKSVAVGKKELTPSPWQTIGPWEIGQRISK